MCSRSQSYHMRTKCAVVGCISTGLTHKLFRFPRENERYRQWADFSQNPKLKNVLNKRAYMCYKHFSTNQFRADEPRRLIYNATPTYLILDNKIIEENKSSSSDDGNNSEQEDEDTSADPQIDQKSDNSDVEYVTEELIPLIIVPDKDDDDDDLVILEDTDVTIIESVQNQNNSPSNNIAKYRELRRIRKSLKRLNKKRMTSLNIWPKETMESFIQKAHDVGFQPNVQPELRNIDLPNQSLDNKLTLLSEETLPTIVKDEHQQMLAQPVISHVTPPTNFTMSSISSGTTQYQIKRSPSQVSRSIVNPINYSDNPLVNVQNNSLICSQSNPLPVQPTTSTVTNSLDQLNVQKQMSEIHEQPSTKILSDPQQVQLKLNVQPLQELIEKPLCSSQVTETHTYTELPPTIKLETSTKLNGSPKSGNFLTTIASILTSSQTNSEKENSIVMDVGTENKNQQKTNIQQTQNHTLKTVDSTMTTSQNDLIQENPTIMNGQFETYHKQEEIKFSPTDAIDQTKICRFFEQQYFNNQQSLNKMSPVTYMKSDLSFVKSTVSLRDKNIQPSNNDQQLIIGNTETITPSKSSSQETPVDIYCSVSKDKSHFSSIDVNKATVPLIKTNSPCTRSIFLRTMDTIVQSMSSQKNSVTSFSHTTKPCLQSTVVDVQSPTKPCYQSPTKPCYQSPTKPCYQSPTKPCYQSTNVDPIVVHNESLTKPYQQSTNVDPTVVNNESLKKPYQQSTNVDPTVVNNESLKKPCHQSTRVKPTVVEIHYSTRSRHKSTYVDRTVVNNESLTKPYQQSTNVNPTVVNNESLTKPYQQSTNVNPTVVNNESLKKPYQQSTNVDPTVVNNESLTKPYQQSTNVDPTVVNNESLTKPYQQSTNVDPTVVNNESLTKPYQQSTNVDPTVVNNESLTKPYQQSTNVDPTVVNNESLTKPYQQSTNVNPTVVNNESLTKPYQQSTNVNPTVVNNESLTKPYQQSTNVNPTVVNNESLTKPYQQSTNVDPTVVNNESLTKPYQQSTNVNPTVVNNEFLTKPYQQSTNVDPTVVNNESLKKPYQQSTNVDPTVVNNESLTKPYQQSTNVNPTVVNNESLTKPYQQSTNVNPTVVNNESLKKPYQQSTNVDPTVVNNESLTKPYQQSTNVDPTVVNNESLTKPYQQSTNVDPTVVNNESLTKPYQQSTNVDPTVVNNEFLKKPCHQSTRVKPTVVEIHYSTRSRHKSTYVDRTVVDSESPTKPCHQSTLVNPTVLDSIYVNSVEQFKKNMAKNIPIVKDCFVDLSGFNIGIKKHAYQSPVIQIVSANQNITQPTFTRPFALESHNVKSQDQHPTALDDKPAKVCKNLQSAISPTVVNYQNELSTFVNPPELDKRTILQKSLPTVCATLQVLDTQNECSQNQQCTDLQPDLSIPSIVARKHALYANKILLVSLKPLNSEKKLSATVPTSEGTLMMPQIKPITQSKFKNLTICYCKKASSSEILTKHHVLEEPPSERLLKRSGILLETHNGSSVNKKQAVDNIESKDEDNYMGIVNEPDIHSPLYKRRGMAFRSILKKRRITNVPKQRKQNVISKISKDSDPLRISSQTTTSYIESHHIKPTVSKVRVPNQHFSQNEVLHKPLNKRIDPSFTLDVRQHFNTIKFKNNKSKAKKSSRTEFEQCLQSKLLLPFSINSKATNDILDKNFNPKDFEVEFQPPNCTPSFEKSLISQTGFQLKFTKTNYTNNELLLYKQNLIKTYAKNRRKLKINREEDTSKSRVFKRSKLDLEDNLSNHEHDANDTTVLEKCNQLIKPGFPLTFTKTNYTNNELLLYKQNLIKTYANNRRKLKTNCEEDTSKSRVFKRSKLDLEDNLSNHEHDTTVLEKCNELSKTIEILDDFDDNINPSKGIQIFTSKDNSDNFETEKSQLLSTNKLVKSISETPSSKIPVVPAVVQQILNSDCEGTSVINYYTNLQPMVMFDQSVTSFEQAVTKYIQSMENSVSNHTGISRQQNHQVYMNYGEQNLRMMGVSSKELMEQDPVKPCVIQLESAWST